MAHKGRHEEGVRELETLGEAFPKQQERLRELLRGYQEIGAAGIFGAETIKDCLRRADKAAIEHDLVAMIRIYEEMKGFK
jgi:hypothetical protein